MSQAALTVFIPTYNRLADLKRQLAALARQPEAGSVHVVVSDNASDWEMEGLKDEFSHVLSLELRRQPVNTGMPVNLCGGYGCTDTDWVWFLGDDDAIVDGCLKVILRDILSAPDEVNFIKYSIEGVGFYPHTRERVSDVDGFISHYRALVRERPHAAISWAGDCGFVSTCVVNVRKVRSWATNGLFFAYNHLSFFVPSLYAFRSGGKMAFSPECIVRYQPPTEMKTHWSVHKFLLGLCSWNDMDIDVSYEGRMWFSMFIAFTINPMMIVVEMQGCSDRQYAWYVLDKVFRHAYCFSPRECSLLLAAYMSECRWLRRLLGGMARRMIDRRHRSLWE